MKPTTNLQALLSNMQPVLNEGDYVFATVQHLDHIPRADTICEVKEKEGITVILTKENAEKYGLDYTYTAAWITLNVHSSLEAVGLTAAFSAVLAQQGISCNVVAGYYHDHIFVDKKDTTKALETLRCLSEATPNIP